MHHLLNYAALSDLVLTATLRLEAEVREREKVSCGLARTLKCMARWAELRQQPCNQ